MFLSSLKLFTRLSLLLVLCMTFSCSLSSRGGRSFLTRHHYLSYPTIILDAGHGGDDSGTQSQGKGKKYYEKDLTLTTTLFLRDHLEKLGYKVVLTRHRDVFIPLEGRSSKANRHRNALFVSVHFNSAPNLKARGVEIYYYDSHKNQARSRESHVLADRVLRHVLHYTKAENRGVKRGNFHVIRETHIPSILIEGGFLSNSSELKKLKSHKYLNRIAWGAAKGLDDFVKSQI
ncbi:Uncharacterized protein YqiI [Chlamydiales bacterium SCGC AG-110-M15]|nr:Uncharacterized protein YqiI [Chlamydiales bacterium SCGC AG-110-M15]